MGPESVITSGAAGPWEVVGDTGLEPRAADGLYQCDATVPRATARRLEASGTLTVGPEWRSISGAAGPKEMVGDTGLEPVTSAM